MKVLDGTQSESTQAPPAPVGLDDGDVRVELGGDQRRLVPGRPAADDHDRDSRCPVSPTDAGRHAPSYSPSPARPGYRHRRASLRRVRLEPRSRPGCGPTVRTRPMVGIGWLEGWRLTFAGEDVIGWEGAVTTIVESPGDRVFVALYDVHPLGRGPARRGRGRRPPGTYRKLHRAGRHAGRRGHRLGLRLRRVRGRLPTAWYLSEIANAAREGGRARRLRRRAARPPHPHRRRP